MKNIILLLILSLAPLCLRASVTDTLVYQLQRQKINGLLAARNLKFGSYSQSLSQHSGIFGLQTKKDIKHSEDILMEMVKTDDTIFKELKILFDYKTAVQQTVERQSVDVQSNLSGYVVTINKLRQQNEILKQQNEQMLNDGRNQRNIYLLMIVLLMLGSISLLYQLRRQKRA